MASEEKNFNQDYIEIIKTGQELDAMSNVGLLLSDLTRIAKKLDGQKKWLFDKAAYTFLTGFGVILVFFGMLLILPLRFQHIFNQQKIQLPIITDFFSHIGNILHKWFIKDMQGNLYPFFDVRVTYEITPVELSIYILGIIVPVGILLFCALLWLLKRVIGSGRYANIQDKLAFRLPILGKMMRRALLSQVIRASGVLIDCGMPMVDALNVLEKNWKNLPVSKLLRNIQTKLKQNEPDSQAILELTGNEHWIKEMVETGEKNSTIGKIFILIVNYQDKEIEDMLLAANYLGFAMEALLHLFAFILVILFYIPLIELVLL